MLHQWLRAAAHHTLQGCCCSCCWRCRYGQDSCCCCGCLPYQAHCTASLGPLGQEAFASRGSQTGPASDWASLGCCRWMYNHGLLPLLLLQATSAPRQDGLHWRPLPLG